MEKGKMPEDRSSAFACARANHTNIMISIFAINLAVTAELHRSIIVIY
jgi:hypothetical protein